ARSSWTSPAPIRRWRVQYTIRTAREIRPRVTQPRSRHRNGMVGSRQPVFEVGFRWFLRRIIAITAIGVALSLLGCEVGPGARSDAGRWVGVVPDAGVDRHGAPDRAGAVDSALPDAHRADGARTDGASTDGARTDGASTDGASTDGARDGKSPGCDAAACQPVVMAAAQNQPCGLALD